MTAYQPIVPRSHLVRHRLFVGLRPPPETRAEIAHHRNRALPCGGNADDRLQLTLFVSDDFENEPVELMETLHAALSGLRLAAFEFSLEGFGHLGSSLVPRRAKALRAFQADIARSLARAGIAARESWTFAPHVTLGYGEPTPFANQPIAPIIWRVREFVLVHSLLRLTMHRTLGRWPLIEQLRLL